MLDNNEGDAIILLSQDKTPMITGVVEGVRLDELLYENKAKQVKVANKIKKNVCITRVYRRDILNVSN